MTNKIYFGDNLPILLGLESESVDLIYIDPPFNTGKVQKRTTIKTVQSATGSRKGFKGKSYETVELGTKSYDDSFDSLVDFLRPRLVEAHRILKPHGSLYFHIDYREVHYCKVLLDEIFGRECFLNEIIWAYDYGGRAKSKWPPKHDNILYYVKNPENYIFNTDAIDREQYIAPGLVGPVKAERGKLPTDTWWFSYVGRKPTDIWWQTIVPTNGKERVGYPTQKPRKLLDRIIKASSHPGMCVLDFFAGSGTIGESCLELGREFILMDNNPASLEVMAQRFSTTDAIEWIGFTPHQGNKIVLRDMVDIASEFDEAYLTLAASITHLQAELEQEDAWSNSPFAWVQRLPEPQRNIAGVALIAAWCQSKGLVLGPGGVLTINGCNVLASFAMLVEGAYLFQLPQKDFDYLLCFGISPKQAHGWILSHNEVLRYAHGQSTKFFTLDIRPENPPTWLDHTDGSFDHVLIILENLSCEK